MSPEFLSFIQDYSPALQKIAGFGATAMVLWVIVHQLLHNLVYAFSPESRSRRFATLPRGVRVALAIANLMAWIIALIITCLIYEISDIMKLVLPFFSLVNSFLTFLLLLSFILFLIYCFSRTGNEFLISILGFWYLHHCKDILDRCRYFDLGHGRLAEIDSIQILSTTFRTQEGGMIVVRPNAFLMYEFLGFTKAIGLEGISNWLKSLTSRESEFTILRQNQIIIDQNDEIIAILHEIQPNR
jgi:hypothetical protein